MVNWFPELGKETSTESDPTDLLEEILDQTKKQTYMLSLILHTLDSEVDIGEL